MELKLTITLVFASVFLIVLTTYVLKKGRIPEKYAILWYVFALIILVMSFCPRFLSIMAKNLGFQLVSNMVLVLLTSILFLLVMSLTIMIAGQKKKTTLLIQEISILKNEVKKNDKASKK